MNLGTVRERTVFRPLLAATTDLGGETWIYRSKTMTADLPTHSVGGDSPLPRMRECLQRAASVAPVSRCDAPGVCLDAAQRPESQLSHAARRATRSFAGMLS